MGVLPSSSDIYSAFFFHARGCAGEADKAEVCWRDAEQIFTQRSFLTRAGAQARRAKLKPADVMERRLEGRGNRCGLLVGTLA